MGFFNLSNQREIDVWIQDQTTQPIHYYLMNELKSDITLTAPISKGDSTFSVSSGHGFTAGGEFIAIWEDDRYLQQEVTAVATDDITVGVTAPYPFSTNAIVIRGDIEMNVNGSVTPVNYQFFKRSGVPVDIQDIHITIWNAAAQGDDSLFGDLAELTNGVYGYKETDTVNGNLGVYKSNSQFREYGAEVTYNDRSGGGGNYGVDVHFDTKVHYGIVIRFDPDNTEKLWMTVRDNLSTLVRFRISVLGQSTLGE